MGTAVPFGLAVARYFTDDATIEHVKAGLVYA
jgi:4-methyl-5(b-hydroxyethyl)-thiazole monophosphate biosynthesis